MEEGTKGDGSRMGIRELAGEEEVEWVVHLEALCNVLAGFFVPGTLLNALDAVARVSLQLKNPGQRQLRRRLLLGGL